MNANFQAWVTSSAFQVSLTVPQMKVLHYLRTYGTARVELLEPMTVFALDRRGLLERTEAGDIRLTKAGTLLAALVEEAGFNDATAGMPTRLDQARKHEATLAKALDLLGQGKNVDAVAAELGVGRSTVYRHLQRARDGGAPQST